MDFLDENELSLQMYRCVENIIGKKRIIDDRRTVTKLYNKFWNICCELDGEDSILNIRGLYRLVLHISGSYGEGFRMKQSDIDLMCIVNNVKLYTSEEDARNSTSDEIKFLVECDTEYPGFAKLKLLSQPNDSFIRQLCIPYDSSLYLSNSKWKSILPKVCVDGNLHGPCQSGIVGMHEVDLAVCLHSKRWPFSTHNFVKRLYKIGWPSPSILKSIVNQGCHLVAIGFPESPHEDLQWRISFSFTEEKLINEMNHCQFLCYGLLKIFLKEHIAVVPQLENLLCSYFMKTLVFWEMTTPSLSWTPSCFLLRFWSCVKKLIHYVQVGYFPNFFIPEYNMFTRKVKGEKQRHLLKHLCTIYKEGDRCLMRSPPFLKILHLICRPNLGTKFSAIESICTKSELDCSLILECSRISDALVTSGKRAIMNTLRILSEDECNRTGTEGICLKILSNLFFQYYIINCACSDNEKNTRNKVAWRNRIHTFVALKKLAVDAVTHRILTALYLYRIGCYQLSIKVLQRAKSKLQNSQTIYLSHLTEDKYRAAGGEHKTIFSMLRNIVFVIGLITEQCMPELRTEFEDKRANSLLNHLIMLPMVLGNFLLYLCYKHERNDHEAQSTLEEFEMMVLSNEYYHVSSDHQAISCNVLAICQELQGDYNGAKESYMHSLHFKYNRLVQATRRRLKNLEQAKSRAAIY